MGACAWALATRQSHQQAEERRQVDGGQGHGALARWERAPAAGEAEGGAPGLPITKPAQNRMRRQQTSAGGLEVKSRSTAQHFQGELLVPSFTWHFRVFLRIPQTLPGSIYGALGTRCNPDSSGALVWLVALPERLKRSAAAGGSPSSRAAGPRPPIGCFERGGGARRAGAAERADAPRQEL